MLKITGTMMLVLMLTALTASAAWVPLNVIDSDQSSSSETYFTAETTVNGNGIRYDDYHNNNKTYTYPDTTTKGMMWLSEMNDVIGAWVAFEFDGPVTVEKLTVWNFNDGSDLNAGIKEFKLWYTNSPLAANDWTLVEETGTSAAEIGTLDITKGLLYYYPNTSIDVATEFPGLEGVELTGVMLDVISTYSSSKAGLSEIRFDGEVVPEPATMGLLAIGGIAMLRSRRRRNKK